MNDEELAVKQKEWANETYDPVKDKEWHERHPNPSGLDSPVPQPIPESHQEL